MCNGKNVFGKKTRLEIGKIGAKPEKFVNLLLKSSILE